MCDPALCCVVEASPAPSRRERSIKKMGYPYHPHAVSWSCAVSSSRSWLAPDGLVSLSVRVCPMGSLWAVSADGRAFPPTPWYPRPGAGPADDAGRLVDLAAPLETGRRRDGGDGLCAGGSVVGGPAVV